MPSLGKILGSEIQRLARRAAQPLVEEFGQDLRRQHRLVAALRAEVESLSKDRRTLMDNLRRRLAQPTLSGQEEGRRKPRSWRRVRVQRPEEEEL